MNVSSVDADLFDAAVRLVRRIAEVGTKIFSSVRVLRHRAFNQQIGYFLVRYEKGVCELAKNLQSEIDAQRMVNLERRIAVIKLVRAHVLASGLR